MLNTEFKEKCLGTMLKEFDSMFRHCRRALLLYDKDIDIKIIKTESKKKFIDLIPDIPYIGGKKNPGTQALVGSVILLSIIKSIEKRSVPERNTGKIIYDTFCFYFQSKPRFILHLIGKLMFTERMIKKRIKTAEWIKSQKYSGSFISTITIGDGNEFDIKHEFTECAIYKFYKKHAALKYMPYLCLGDYISYQAMGIGLTRTQTIGNGARTCDFCLKKNGETPDGWPPENLPEWRG